MIQIQTDLGVPKYNQKVMTSDQSKSFVNTYKKNDQNTRIAMLQGLELQFGDLNNKAFQQLLNDGLPETAILSSYFQNPEMTEAFLSFDSPEKKTELKDWGTKNGVKFNKLQKDIATSKAIRIFEDIVAQNTGANSADTVEQMGNIVEILSYYTLNEMFTNNKNEVNARKNAVGIIKDNFQIEDTYYIPKIWDGKKLLDSHLDIIVAKTEIIKDHYLDQWGAVAFGSMKDDTLTIDIQSEFEINMKDNGEWRNTSDGEGLIFGIVLADGEFAPVKNANGNFLEFDFDNDQYILPGTDIKLNMTLNDFMPDKSESASLPSDNLIFDENTKPRFAGLVETNKFFKYVKDKEGAFFKSATKATEGEAKLTIGYGRYGAAEGQTVNKEEAEQMLLEDIESRIPEVINAIPKFDSFSDELQQALFYEWFRGSLVQSPKTRKLINEGKLSEAAKEFLNNDEYRNAKKNKRSGIIKHMNLVSELLNKEGTI
jgi:GH24 family phage-related lysozyme (muramidase)